MKNINLTKGGGKEENEGRDSRVDLATVSHETDGVINFS